jgi:hypothetical protein
MAFYHMYVQWVVFYTIVLLTELFSIGDLEEVVGRGSVGGFIRGSVGGVARGSVGGSVGGVFSWPKILWCGLRRFGRPWFR